MESRVHKYTFHIRPVPLCEGLHISEPLESSSPKCNEEEENTHKKNTVLYFKKSGVLPERNLPSVTQNHSEINF